MFLLPQLERYAQVEKTIHSFKGLNKSDTIKDEEFADCSNVMTPADSVLKVCNPIHQEGSPTNAEIHFVSINSSLYRIVLGAVIQIIRKPASSDEEEQTIFLRTGEQLLCLAEFEGDTVVFTLYLGKYYLLRYQSNGSIAQNVELTSLFSSNDVNIAGVVAYRDRLILMQDECIHISYQGALDKWEQYLDPEEFTILPENAWGISIKTEGAFVGGANFQNSPIFFTKTAMYQLVNEYTPFSLQKIADVGCINGKTIAVCKNKLFFLSQSGVMSYDGRQIALVSQNCPELAGNAREGQAACADGRYYYLGNYFYDTEEEVWGKLQDNQILDSQCCYNGKVYFSECENNAETKQYRLYWYQPFHTEDLEPVNDWYFITKRFHENDENQKSVAKLALRVEPKQDADVRVFLSLDGGDWQEMFHGSFTKSRAQKVLLRVPLCEDFQIKVSGQGKVVIPYLKFIYRRIPDQKIHPFQ